ncbi:TIP41-like protein isoform X2 [Cimex lectularius]|nr:TIP41-like protein isoform X2 [Cimex lectularius]XP_014255106.1 TIP41-like protein isoform X2 [Cimex lectularius]XP_024081930.1 TIP41-like protein isoform X2 [Cimex lectularius]
MESSDQVCSNMEEHNFQDWTVRYRSSHILPSKCTDNCKSGNTECTFCRYNHELNLTHLPEMVFPNNILQLVHKSGCSVEFNAFDALKLVKSENMNVKISCAETWKRAREDTGLVERTVGDFDWTFQTNYKGTFSNLDVHDSEVGIDMEKLRQKEEILLYRNLTLFEDELHDNGIAVCSVRIRVMPSGFFILLRYFLRVDNVIIVVNDSRIYHDFTTDYIILETAQRENKVSDLRVPIGVMNEPDEVTPLLALKSSKCQKLVIPKCDL